MFPSQVILFLRYKNNQFQIQSMFECPVLKRKGDNILIKQFSSNILNRSTDKAKLSNANHGPWSLSSRFISKGQGAWPV